MKYPRFVKNIVHLSIETTGKLTPLKQDTLLNVQTEKSKKKNAKKARSLKREIRVFSNAAQVYFDHVDDLAERSERKRKNGASKDRNKNAFLASKKATHILRKKSRLYNQSKFVKRLHTLVINHQQKSLGRDSR